MKTQDEKALKTLKPGSVFLPIIIAAVVIIIAFWSDPELSQQTFDALSKANPVYLILAFLTFGLKDLSNAIRFKFISDRNKDILSCLRIIFLWEFAIAVTPPIIGATAVLVFIIYREGFSVAKALAYTLLLATFDNVFFLTATPIAYLFTDGNFIPKGNLVGASVSSISSLFWLSYGLIAFYTTFMLSAILFAPKLIKRLVERLFSIKFLMRWKVSVSEQLNDLVVVSQVLTGKRFGFWFSIVCFSYAVWVTKYAILNIIISGYVQADLATHLGMLARHLSLWIVMLVSPAPGNAGLAEVIFPSFFHEYLGGNTFAVGLLWRFFSYYPYLIVGAFILPSWLKGKKKGLHSQPSL